MRICLDTSAYSAFKRGHPEAIDELRRAREIVLPPIVLGELLAGFRIGSRDRANRRELEAFLSSPRVRVSPIDAETAQRYAEIFSYLRERGTPIPTNDIWIAAHALESGADLVSFDLHFEVVDGVAWVRPA